MTKIDEFKEFVRTKPSLISYVRSGEMTWQKFYEMWFLYGSNHEEWNKYNGNTGSEDRTTASTTTKPLNFGINDIFNAIKKVDMNKVQENIVGIQKALGVIQGLATKSDGTVSSKEPYNPRPIFKRFED